MSFLDIVKDTASDVAERSRENKVDIRVTAGKKCFCLGPFESRVIIRQNRDGFIYFDDINGLFKITDYQWSGPMYQTVTQTTGQTVVRDNTRSKGREKRTGRLTGAVVGTMILPGPGTLIGAMVGTGNKKSRGTSQNRGTHTTTSTTQDMQVEVPTTAYMTVLEPSSGDIFTFGFDCDSAKNVEIMNLLHRSLLEE